ncbi:MAG: HEPN domain-containing protein [Deltaproteobacteria bacterium]|nr:HEPN domain-containing protein [Deltaproteobacteria bacterium]
MDRSKDWLRQAKRDLERATIDIKYAFFEWACFTSQQAAEKAIKAVFQAQNMSVRGHSTVKMLEGLKDQMDLSEEIFHAARVLDRYYIESRDPNGFPEGSPMDFFDKKIADEAYDAASQILRWSENTICRL